MILWIFLKDEKDKRIQELTAELRVKKRLSAAYKEQLLSLMKDVENHNEHLSTKVQVVRNNLKELEARRQELVNHNSGTYGEFIHIPLHNIMPCSLLFQVLCLICKPQSHFCHFSYNQLWQLLTSYLIGF